MFSSSGNRTKTFERSARRFGISDAELHTLEEAINPRWALLSEASGGVRKIRSALGLKGKRSGGRAMDLIVRLPDAAYLVLANARRDQTDMWLTVTERDTTAEASTR